LPLGGSLLHQKIEGKRRKEKMDKGKDQEGEEPYSPWLVVHDGIPWYASSDIWVVPGSDPGGVQGSPVAGKTNWVWARVWNDGDAPIFNALVNFYWANPATGVTRTNATLISTEFVSVPGKSYKEIYCPKSWVPTMVNNGHECLVVEAYEPILDPLLFPGSNDFHVTADRHVAQRNINVIMSLLTKEIKFEFEIVNPDMEKSEFIEAQIERVPLEKISELAKSLGLKAWPEEQRAECKIQLLEAEKDEPCTGIEVEPGRSTRMVALVAPTPNAREGEAHAYSITQQVGDQTTGGIVLLVINRGR